MRITSKGQVTIPIEIRKRTGLLPHTEVRFEVDGKAVRILRQESSSTGRGASLLERMRGKATSEHPRGQEDGREGIWTARRTGSRAGRRSSFQALILAQPRSHAFGRLGPTAGDSSIPSR